MALEIFWGSGSPFAWTVLLALEFKGQPYESHLLQFSKNEHKTPEMLKMNPRGKVPILRDGATAVYESQAILWYLERKFPTPPLFGETAAQTALVTQIISEQQSYLGRPMIDTVRPFLFGQYTPAQETEVRKNSDLTHQELKFFENRLQHSSWLAGSSCTAADLTLFPVLQLFIRGLQKEGAQALNLGFLPFERHFPKLAAWCKRVEALPGYVKTYPPHWKA